MALGDWLSRFDTGWWAINKVINYIMIDSSAALLIARIYYLYFLKMIKEILHYAKRLGGLFLYSWIPICFFKEYFIC